MSVPSIHRTIFEEIIFTTDCFMHDAIIRHKAENENNFNAFSEAEVNFGTYKTFICLPHHLQA